MNEVAVDVTALQAFVDASAGWASRLIERRDQLVAQRLPLTAALPDHLVQPAIGQLDEVIDYWRATAEFVADVRDDILLADQQWLFEGGAPRGRFDLRLAGSWTEAEVHQLVELGEERTRLRRLAALNTPEGVDARRRLGMIEAEMAELSSTMDHGGWSAVAYLRAGIEPDWNPSDDLVDNDATVRGIYQFYGDLYLEDPNLLWAAMAGLAGRQLYAGWQDLYTARHMLDEGSRMKYLLELADIPTGPDVIYDVVGLAADLSGGSGGPLSLVQTLAAVDLEWLETKMLSMAKEIFDDVGWMHMAYHYGGIDALESSLHGAHRWDVRAMYRMIDSGDPAKVWQAAQAMVVREQRDTIQDNWDEIHDRHGPVGDVITEFVTWTTNNPIPGGRPYREVMSEPTGMAHPVAVLPEFDDLDDFDFSFPTIKYEEIQGPKGNVANYEDRKQWIDLDIGPAFHRLVTEHPEQLEAILRTPVGTQASEQRLHPLPYPGEQS